METSITLHAVVWRIVPSFINYTDYPLTFFVLRTISEMYRNFELSHERANPLERHAEENLRASQTDYSHLSGFLDADTL